MRRVSRAAQIYNRLVRWSRLGIFNKIFAELARKACKPSRLMIGTPPI